MVYSEHDDWSHVAKLMVYYSTSTVIPAPENLHMRKEKNQKICIVFDYIYASLSHPLIFLIFATPGNSITHPLI